MRPTTQLRILDYLRKQQTASVYELSRFLAMTGANIRHHLAVLESNHLIEIISQRREGRGRPVAIYGFSRHLLGDGLDELAGALLNVWLRDMPEVVLEAGLRAVALQLAGENLPGPDILLQARLARLVDQLNKLHYHARWEAGEHGPNIILGHCPYATIIVSHPGLCRMDAFLLEQWTRFPVEQTARLHMSAKGVPSCSFGITGNR